MKKQILFTLILFSLFIDLSAQEKIYTHPDNMPCFPNCESTENEDARKDCTEQKIKVFIKKNLRFPQDVNAGIVEGKVKLTYIVEKDGSILYTEIINSLSESCDKEAKRVVESMPLFIPAKDNQLKVRAIDTIEVNFSLIFRIVENMPTFPGCEYILDRKEKNKCATQKLKEYILENMEYPDKAWDEGSEGQVVVQFIVTKSGELTEIQINDGFSALDYYKGGNFEEEAIRIIESMPNWNPGTQRGNPVKVQYNLPIKFDIEDYENYFRQKAKAERRAKKKAKKG